jgi:AcrR family transcriptional regulator
MRPVTFAELRSTAKSADLAVTRPDEGNLILVKPPEGQRPPRTRLAPEARRDQILDAAARTVLRDGVGAVGVAQLAQDVGISKALAYSYFRSRDDLLAALLQREQRDLRDRGMRAAMQAKSFTGLIRRTTRLWLEQSRDRGALVEALLADPSVDRLMASENRAERESTVRFLVRAVRRRYGLALETSIAAVRLLMPVTGEAGKAVAEGLLTVDEAEELCVRLITGALSKLSTSRPGPHRGQTRRGVR